MCLLHLTLSLTSPFISPGPVAGRCCTASGAGLHDGITGRPCEFELQARDSFGNPVAGGGGGPFKMEARTTPHATLGLPNPNLKLAS